MARRRPGGSGRRWSSWTSGVPQLNGYEAVHRIRGEPKGRAVRRVALTWRGLDEDKPRAAGAGFDHHLTKPADPAVLTDLLGQLDAPPDGCLLRSRRPA